MEVERGLLINQSLSHCSLLKPFQYVVFFSFVAPSFRSPLCQFRSRQEESRKTLAFSSAFFAAESSPVKTLFIVEIMTTLLCSTNLENMIRRNRENMIRKTLSWQIDHLITWSAIPPPVCRVCCLGGFPKS